MRDSLSIVAAAPGFWHASLPQRRRMLQLRASSSSQLLGAFLSDKKKNKRQPCNWQQSQQIKRPVPTCVGSGHGDEDERFAKKISSSSFHYLGISSVRPGIDRVYQTTVISPQFTTRFLSLSLAPFLHRSFFFLVLGHANVLVDSLLFGHNPLQQLSSLLLTFQSPFQVS